MNKSFFTNLIALTLTIIGYFYTENKYAEYIFSTGVFALSGAVTNWLAVHMLFEKIPFLYGSGVIVNRFEDFKSVIKNLIINEFFNKEHIEKFFNSEESPLLSPEEVSKNIDFDKAFDHLTDAIVESPLGGMLAMMGGKEALIPLKEPIQGKMHLIITDVISSNLSANGDEDSSSDSNGIDGISKKIEEIIDKRLEDLTPQMVKEMIQDMIRKHLGWLVVWGGVFGGLIGFAVSFLS